MDNTIKPDQNKNVELIRLLESSGKSGFSESESANGSNKWTEPEIRCLLKLIAEYNYHLQLAAENEQVYTKLSKLMTVSGHTKTKDEIKIHWLFLKQQHQDYTTGILEEFKYADEIRELTSSQPKKITVKREHLEDNILSSIEFGGNEFKYNKGIKRNIWSENETDCIIQVLEKYGMPTRSNLRKICYIIVDYLKQNGYTRNEEQVQIKIKQLRLLYNQVIRKVIKEIEFPFFKRLDVLMQLRELPETKDYIIANEDDSYTEYINNIPVKYNSCVTDDELVLRKGRQIWSYTEVSVLISFIEENGIVTGKQLSKLIDKAAEYLASYGYTRTPTQILVRWKNTKAQYWSTLRKNVEYPEKDCAFFYRLHTILNPDENNFEEEEGFSQTNESIDTNTQKIESSPINLPDDIQSSSNSTDNFVVFENSSIANQTNVIEITDPLEGECNSGQVESLSPNPKRNRLQQSIYSYRHDSLDSVDHYCIALAHNIKKLDSRKQAKLKIEIQKLMYQAEFDSDF